MWCVLLYELRWIAFERVRDLDDPPQVRDVLAAQNRPHAGAANPRKIRQALYPNPLGLGPPAHVLAENGNAFFLVHGPVR